uniref:Mesenchyme-specific cell surface glycoprotein n=1 Tax=Magallana gigas TaxID=29159 RepID=K1S4P3_MAGGI
MRVPILLVFFPCLIFVKAQVPPPNVHLEKISTLYVPSRYNSHDYPEFKLGRHAAEQLAYDPAQKILYVTGEERLNVVDLSNPSDPIMLYRKQFVKMDPTDVEYCGNHVFVSVANDEKPEDGKVLVFRKYNRRHNTMPIVLEVVVGPSPNMLLPTINCQKVLVALEGEAFARGGNLIDPEGAIGLLKFPSSYISDTTYSYKVLDFRSFNDKYPILARSGVRYVYKENGNTLAQDLEPEHITFSADEKKAYISLQENNAIAEVDMVLETITDLRGLGFKDWAKYKLDPSDEDGGINIYPYPIYGMYQPDAIRTVTIGGREYIVTADEGDSKDYSGLKLTTSGFDETKRVRDITLANNSEVLQWARKRKIPSIQHDALLGKLSVSTQEGRLRDGTYDKLYSYGGRGFSVLRSDTMERIYDSGSIVEESHAMQYPKLFNSYAKSSVNITDTQDSRSDSKGPECESLAIAYSGTRVIVFVGCERPGTISIYSFNSNMTEGTLESIYSGAKTVLGTWGEAFDGGLLTDMDTDDIKCIPPSIPKPDGSAIVGGYWIRYRDSVALPPLPNPRVNSRVPVKPLQSSPLPESTPKSSTKTSSASPSKSRQGKKLRGRKQNKTRNNKFTQRQRTSKKNQSDENNVKNKSR